MENKLGSMADELTSTSSRISTKNDSNKFVIKVSEFILYLILDFLYLKTGDLNELERQMAGLKSELVKVRIELKIL